jgi:hypothetical protein
MHQGSRRCDSRDADAYLVGDSGVEERKYRKSLSEQWPGKHSNPRSSLIRARR